MSKGKKKTSLFELSRERPTREESAKIRRYLLNASDTEAAISFAAFVEQELEFLIFGRLQINDPGMISDLTGDRGFLSTFNDKITLGHAIRLYGPEVEHNLNIVRRIRNVFAHSAKIRSFDIPLIAQELRKAKIRPRQTKKWSVAFKEIQSGKYEPRGAYVLLCGDCLIYLLDRHTRLLKSRNDRSKDNALINALMSNAQQQPQEENRATKTQNQNLGSIYGGVPAPPAALHHLSKLKAKKGEE